ncbi:MAG: META domain-containing protein [Rikenellaceae bacterium]|nr:META domain-containing protein [Rikenellaceae bacterium]MCL2692254.1 META domain-containing protein [Rikenellaceae bacterium]
MKKLMGILMLAAVLLTATSCCNCGKRAGRTAPLGGSGEWQLTRIENDRVTPVDNRFTLSFAANGNVAGMGFCNRVTGTYESSAGAGALAFGPLATTRMMCLDQAAEDRFLRILGTIDSYKIFGRTLMLFSENELKMTFEKR